MMRVENLMTEHPATCTPETRLQDAARMMVEHDCGAIPVVDRSGKALGVITDRDIVVRVVAHGESPLEKKVADVMTSQVFTVHPETNADDCFNLMEEKQVRRVVVVDESNRIRGIVAQADIARQAPSRKAGEVVRDVSQPAA